jgi:putative tryptophan/tyrosine transport system substrate-binding protein
MRRREFIAGLAGATTWPLAARAQQPALPVIGYLDTGAPEPNANNVAAFRKGLSEMRYVESRNVAIEFRWAHNEYDRLPELAADLVHRRVAVIAAMGGAGAALAAKAATTTIPIVFRTGLDPVQFGLVASLNRPGGNLTGVGSMTPELVTKRLGLLHELLPGAARFAVLVDPNSQSAETVTREVQAAAITQQIEVLHASTNPEINTAFESLVQKRADALLVGPNILFENRRVQLVTLAAHHRVPAIYFQREFVEAGGLMSYGESSTDQFRQAGIYTGRILKGEKPGDLPVMRPTKFEFIINLQTAGLLGITIPPTLLAIADEVIQ